MGAKGKKKMAERKEMRVFSWVLLTGPVWAAVLGWCLRNDAANRLAVAESSDGTQYELVAQSMSIALWATVAGAVCFLAGLALLFLLRTKRGMAGAEVDETGQMN